jgi:hypothetical protein
MLLSSKTLTFMFIYCTHQYSATDDQPTTDTTLKNVQLYHLRGSMISGVLKKYHCTCQCTSFFVTFVFQHKLQKHVFKYKLIIHGLF